MPGRSAVSGRSRLFSTSSSFYSNNTASEPTVVLTTTSIPGTSKTSSTYVTMKVHNPSKLNSLNSTLLTSLSDSFNSSTEIKDPSVRAVILTSTPPPKTPSFCSGASVIEMSAITSPSEALEFISRISAVCTSIRNSHVPVIAVIDGLCFGAGLEIAASCDFRICTKRSTFSMPEVKLGIPSVVEARLLPNLVGWQKSKRLCMLAETIDANTAEEWGLVDWNVDHGEGLERKVVEVLGLIGEMAPKAMTKQKELCNFWEEHGQVEGIEEGKRSFKSVWEDEGGKEVNAYMGAMVRKMKERKK